MLRHRQNDTPRKRRSRLHGFGRKKLSRQWQRWVAENLLEGVAPATIYAELRSKGVPPYEANRRIQEISASPAFHAAHQVSQRARRLALAARLSTDVASRSPRPRDVERTTLPTPETFFERYYATNTPVVFTDATRDWPARERWTPAHLRERFGDVTVQVVTGRDGDPQCDANYEKHLEAMSFAQYLDKVEAASDATNDFYMIANNKNIELDALQPLFDDVRLPTGILDEKRMAGGRALWIGPAGTVTALHHDTSSILFFQLYGRKRFKLVSPLEALLLEGAQGVYNRLDCDAPDRDAFPSFDDITIRTVDVAPGEALFIPVGWWHHVRALDVSISLALNNLRCPNSYEWYKPGAR